MSSIATPTFANMDTEAFSVSDYLQLAAMSKRSVLMTLSRNDMKVGEIYVIDGDVHAASDAFGEGAPAFSRLVFDADVHVGCQPLSGPLPAKNIHGRIEQLLLDAARSSDEQRREDEKAVQIIELAHRRPPPPPPPRKRSQQAPPPPLQPEHQRDDAMQQPSKSSRGAVGSASPSLEQLLATTPGLRGAVISSYDGELHRQVGDIDAETAAAVVAMALRSVWKACEEIGLGAPASWSATLGDESWYVSHGETEVVTVVGTGVDNPEAIMRKLAAALAGVLS